MTTLLILVASLCDLPSPDLEWLGASMLWSVGCFFAGIGVGWVLTRLYDRHLGNRKAAS